MDSVGGQFVYCYNKGCGKKFDPFENTNDSCIYHPGPPYFHDAYKIWKCCNKKSTDFSTWLEIKGCTRGKHSNEKPTEEVIPKIASAKEITTENPERFVVWNGLNKPAPRSKSCLREFVKLPIEVGLNAQRTLEKYMEKLSISMQQEGEFSVKIGDSCSNNSCNMVFSGITEGKLDCVYHPGTAIFHEGMKYWSCCQKKTSDFTLFLDQAGCTKGLHCWEKPKVRDEVLREDWFQALGLVHINIYCKGALPDKCRFECDGLNLRIHLTHGYGEKENDREYALFGEVLTEKSHAIINERKVEIILKQIGGENWPKLVYDGNCAAGGDSDDEEFVLGE